MRRKDVLLVLLSTRNGKAFSPVQIQKALFLLTEKVPEIFGTNPKYKFKPYDYGPFSKEIYDDLDGLSTEGLITISRQPGKHWKTFTIAENGRPQAETLMQSLSERHHNYISEVAKFVSKHSFTDLVSAIYREYPEMRANSIFVEQNE